MGATPQIVAGELRRGGTGEVVLSFTVDENGGTVGGDDDDGVECEWDGVWEKRVCDEGKEKGV